MKKKLREATIEKKFFFEMMAGSDLIFISNYAYLSETRMKVIQQSSWNKKVTYRGVRGG